MFIAKGRIYDQSWMRCFPAGDIPQIMEYLVNIWSDFLKRLPDNQFINTWTEPEITKSLSVDLNDFNTRKTFGIGGRFDAERLQLSISRKTGKAITKGRTDIEYFHPSSGMPTLTIEFKKLSGESNPRYDYRIGGMARFINGIYAEEEEHGVMCGLVLSNKPREISLIIKNIEKNATDLKCIKYSQNFIIKRPSDIAPNIADFDTQHHRNIKRKTNIKLAHLFLEIERN